jgi:hypothetical protein
MKTAMNLVHEEMDFGEFIRKCATDEGFLQNCVDLAACANLSDSLKDRKDISKIANQVGKRADFFAERDTQRLSFYVTTESSKLTKESAKLSASHLIGLLTDLSPLWIYDCGTNRKGDLPETRPATMPNGQMYEDWLKDKEGRGKSADVGKEMTTMTESQPTARELLKDEYLQLQKTIEDFDQRTLTIKNWSVVFGFASIGVAFTSHRAGVLIVSALSAGTFWILETLWKKSQDAYYERTIRLEDYFRGDVELFEPFQITASWYASWTTNWWATFFKILRRPNVALPHLVVILIALAFFAIAQLSPFNV